MSKGLNDQIKHETKESPKLQLQQICNDLTTDQTLKKNYAGFSRVRPEYYTIYDQQDSGAGFILLIVVVIMGLVMCHFRSHNQISKQLQVCTTENREMENIRW